MSRVAIVGAGISGLSLAYRLQEAGVEVHVFEGAQRPGGTVRSELHHGFRIEWGPNGFLDNKASTLKLVQDLNLEVDLVSASDATQRRYIFADGRLHELPSSPARFLTSSALPPLARLRVLMEPLVPAKRDSEGESVASFARRRLGATAARRLIDPMVSGIHAADPERLELGSAFPRLQALEQEYGSLIRGALSLARARKKSGDTQGAADARGGGPGGQLHSFRAGLETLITRLAQSITHLHLETPIHSLKRQSDGTWLLPQAFDAVVLAVPPRIASDILQPLDSDLAGTLGSIESAGVAVVALGFHRSAIAHSLDGFGYLVPGGDPVLGCLWTSSIWTGHRSPKDHVLLRVLVGGRRHPQYLEMDDESLLRHCRQHIDPTLGVVGTALVQRVIRQKLGIPQYELGHGERMAAINESLESYPGLWLAGNGYKGIGVNDCTEQAEGLAAQILASL